MLRETLSLENSIVHGIDDQAGIYSESIGTMTTVRKTWRLVTFIDLAPYFIQRDRLEFGVNEVLGFCGNSTCINSQELVLIQRRLTGLKISQEEISEMLTATRRNKRSLGPLKYVGKLSRFLFGQLNEDDKEVIDMQIKYLARSDQTILNVIANQTQIVKNQFLKAGTLVNNVTESIINEIGRMTNDFSLINDRFKQVEQVQKIMSATSVLSRELTDLEYDSDLLTNAIIFAREGQLHPRLFTHQNLVDLRAAIYNDEIGMALPLLENDLTISGLARISKIISYITGKIITFVLEIPVVTREPFSIYQHFPLPMDQHFNNTYAYISPPNPYVALSTDRDKYIMLSATDLHSCRSLNSQFICSSRPIYHVTENSPCEIRLLSHYKSNGDIFRNCRIFLKILEEPVFTKLSQLNSWLFTSPGETRMNVICKHDQMSTINLHGNGILQLHQGCTGKTNTVTLQAMETVTSFYNLTRQQLSDVNIGHILSKNLLSHSINISDLVQVQKSLEKTLSNNDLNDATAFDYLLDKTKQIMQQKVISTQLSDIGNIQLFSNLSFTSVMILGIIIFVIFKFRIWKVTSTSKTVSESKTPNQHTDNVNVQVQLNTNSSPPDTTGILNTGLSTGVPIPSRQRARDMYASSASTPRFQADMLSAVP